MCACNTQGGGRGQNKTAGEEGGGGGDAGLLCSLLACSLCRFPSSLRLRETPNPAIDPFCALAHRRPACTPPRIATPATRGKCALIGPVAEPNKLHIIRRPHEQDNAQKTTTGSKPRPTDDVWTMGSKQHRAWQCAADSVQPTTRNRQHATDNTQQTTCNRQHAAHSVQLTASLAVQSRQLGIAGQSIPRQLCAQAWCR